MKYFKLFQSVADANTQGEAGLASPHISIVEGKNVVNMVKMSENPFNETFSDDGSIVTYAGWDIEGTYDTSMYGMSLNCAYGNSNGCVIDYDAYISSIGDNYNFNYIWTDEYNGTIQTFENGELIESAGFQFLYENKKYKLLLVESKSSWFIYSKEDKKTYMSMLLVPDIDRKEEYTTLYEDEAGKSIIAEYMSQILNISNFTINSIKYPTQEEYNATIQKYITNATANGIDTTELSGYDSLISQIYEEEGEAALYLGKINYTSNGETHNICLLLIGL